MNRELIELKEYLEKSWLPSNDRPGVDILRLEGCAFLSFQRKGIFSNWILDSNFSKLNRDHVFNQAEQFFCKERATGFNWIVFADDHTPEISKWLLAKKFSVSESVDVRVRDLATSEIETVTDSRIKQVSTREELAIAIRLDDSFAEHTEEHIAKSIEKNIPVMEKGQQVWFLGYEDGKAVAMTSISFIPEKSIAYLAGATTLTPYRGKGLYSVMLFERLKLAKEKGMRWAATHAVSDTSSPILEKFSFAKLSTITCYGFTYTE